MKIGIIADTHDNLPKIEKAVRFLNKNRVEFVLHAGDFIAPFAAVKLKNLSCDFRGVFGNNDGEKQGLAQISENRIQNGPLRLTLGGRRIVLVHDINSINPTTEEAQLIVFGHSHKPEISKKDSLILVNPGECAGWLSNRSSVAIVDLNTLSPKIFYL
jgi:hypothetical protein